MISSKPTPLLIRLFILLGILLMNVLLLHSFFSLAFSSSSIIRPSDQILHTSKRSVGHNNNNNHIGSNRRKKSLIQTSIINTNDNNDLENDQYSTINNNNNNYHELKGKNKWLGGAIDPKNGVMYGIPSNANEIICLVPPNMIRCCLDDKNNVVEEQQQQKHEENQNEKDVYQILTVSLPKNVTKGKFKWLRGIICHDCLYGIPAWSNDGVLKLDLQKLWDRVDRQNLDNKSQNVIEIDVDDENDNGLVSIISLPNEFYAMDESEKPSRWLWHGAALNSNKTAIYCIPSNAQHILKVDLEGSKCSFLSIPETTTPLKQTNKWYGGILG